MKKAYIALVLNGADNKNYERKLKAHLEKEGISAKVSCYQSDLKVEYDSWLLRPGVVFFVWPELKDVLPPYAHHFVFFYYKPTVRNIAAKTHTPLLWGKNTVVMSIPIIDNQEWMEGATLHEWVHACHVIKMRHFIPTKDTMDRHPGYLDGVEENMVHIRPHWDTILKTPKAIGLMEQMLDVLKKMIEKLQQLVALKKKPPEVIADPAPDPVPEALSKLDQWALAIQTMEGWFSGSLTWRHNNPGALRFSIYETDNKNGFSVFPDYEAGFKALKFQLQIAADGRSKIYRPEMTLLEFFKTYAPSSDNNDPENYAKFVAGKLSVPINTQIKTLV